MNRIEKNLKWLEDWVIRLDREIKAAHTESDHYAKKPKIKKAKGRGK